MHSNYSNLIIVLLMNILYCTVAAESLLDRRPNDPRYTLGEYPMKSPDNHTIELDALPSIPVEDNLSSAINLYLKHIEFSGNTIFSDQDLAIISRPYEGRLITAEELQTLRRELTLHYIKQGYVNSGAVIPDQKITEGHIEIKIIEGQLNQIDIISDNRLRSSYIRKRLQLGNESTLNFNILRKQIQLLYKDRLIDRINANFLPGINPGESILQVEVQESRPYELGISFNNHRSPNIGSLRGELYGAVYNLTGFGDVLTARYGRTDGIDDWSIAYAIPLTAYDTRLTLFYDTSDADIINEAFKGINISSETENFGLTLSHPLYRTVQSELITSLTLEKRRSQSHIPVLTGSSNSLTDKRNITVIRFSQEWLHRNAQQVIAVRSSFNFGNAWYANIDSEEQANGDYFSWLGQLQWVKKLWNTDNYLVVRSYLQLAADPLLPLAKFGIGGSTTVRGYRENLFVRDNAWVSSIELRLPVLTLPVPWLKGGQDSQIEFASFYDFGWAEDNWVIHNNIAKPPTRTISSVGIGVRWTAHDRLHSNLYWGFPLRNISNTDKHELQDSGIHFSLNFQLFE